MTELLYTIHQILFKKTTTNVTLCHTCNQLIHLFVFRQCWFLKSNVLTKPEFVFPWCHTVKIQLKKGEEIHLYSAVFNFVFLPDPVFELSFSFNFLPLSLFVRLVSLLSAPLSCSPPPLHSHTVPVRTHLSPSCVCVFSRCSCQH